MDLKTIEIRAWSSWKYFKDCFIEARRDYSLYGEIALTRNLDEETIAKYKAIFTNSSTDEEFYNNLRTAWEQEYHHVANNYRELVDLYKYAASKGLYERFSQLLPDTNRKCRTGERTGTDDPFAITKELYDSILKKVQWYNGLYGTETDSSKEYIIDDKTKDLYYLYISKRDYWTYGYVQMGKLDPTII